MTEGPTAGRRLEAVRASRLAPALPPAEVRTLLEALPYMREFGNRTIVIKYGGAAMTDPLLRDELARDVVLLRHVGMRPVLVHGGGPEISAYMRRLGMAVEFVDGMRVSDQETVEVAKMVLLGKQNKDLVLRLGRHGQPAVGLCGDDGRLFTVRPRGGAQRALGYVGRITDVDVRLIEQVAGDYIPVIASVAADELGQSYNVNADEAAGALAGALGAYKLVFLTDVAGWLRSLHDPDSLVRRTTAAELRGALAGVSGGMRPKLEACLHALDGGVAHAHIVDGRRPHALLMELFTDEGVGTKVWADGSHGPGAALVI